MQVVGKAASVAVAILLAGAGTARAKDTKGVEATVRSGAAAWVKAYNAGDADAIVALYADDAVVMPPGVPAARGRAAIKETLVKGIAGAQQAGVSLALTKEDVAVSGKSAWHSGSWTATDKGGKVVDSGSFLDVWHDAGGKWLVVRDIWNSDRPPPAPTAAAK